MDTLSTYKIDAYATLATVIDRVLTDPLISEANRREIKSAITTVARVLKSEPHLISAQPAALRAVLNSALPMAAGVSDTRWRNAKSLMRQGLALLDVGVIPARSKTGLLPGWRLLLDDPDAAPFRRGLARFSKYCSALGIEPQAVDQAVYDIFYSELEEHGLMRCPRESHQAAGHAWNKARIAVIGWPQAELAIQDFRVNRSMDWSGFPESFVVDVDAYLTPMSSDTFDLRRDTPTLRAATIAGKRLMIRQFSTALVESGKPASSIRTLADLVDIEAAHAGLTVFLKRSSQPKTKRNHAMACMLLSIARHYVRPDKATLKDLALFVKNLNPKQSGMTLKNRKRLQQFDNSILLDNLLGLPAKLMAEACREQSPSLGAARNALLAVLIEILTVAPLRISNIAALELGRTLFLDGGTVGHIIIDHTEVKNELDLEVPLPESTLRLINTYLKRFHPILAPAGCRMLFPSRDGGHRRAPSLATQVRKLIARRCGVDINPHLFRHLAAKIYLDAFPGAYGVIRMLLGHKNIATTIRTYCGMEFSAAYRCYDALIEARRAGNQKIIESTSRMKGRK